MTIFRQNLHLVLVFLDVPDHLYSFPTLPLFHSEGHHTQHCNLIITIHNEII